MNAPDRFRFLPGLLRRASARPRRRILVIAALMAVACGGDAKSPTQPTPMPTPTPPACPAPAGTGAVQSATFNWKMLGREGATFQLPFQINGGGAVEARTTTRRGYMLCQCIGPHQACTGDCRDTGANDSVVEVCSDPLLTPGQWQVQVYCRGYNTCVTPLPAEGLSGTTTVTYRPR